VTKKKILILGGTGEAAELARRLVTETSEKTEVITSLAGRTKNPKTLPGRVFSDGFGGIQGLKSYIENENIDLLIDATHPFAENISENGYIASTVTNALRMTLSRPEWVLPPNAKWVEVDDMAVASDAVGAMSKRCFLTIGTGGLEAFSNLDSVWFLTRLIEQPSEPIPLANHEIILGRPPHDVDSERKLINEHRIDCLVSKHAGGKATEGKIIAALDADIPIVLIRRPLRLPGNWTESVDDCFAWINEQI
jgi:precorrin-6A/cobalt-precorrin-6A reductase